MRKSKPPAETHSWTFLTNDSHVLVCLYREPGIRLRGVAERVGITERAVQKTVQDLEVAGIVTRCREGRRNRYTVKIDRMLGHPIEQHRSIGDLLALVE